MFVYELPYRGTAGAVSLLRGDASHIPLADGTVQTCVTSPPYWGLRDYGLATWDGGRVDCDHEGDGRYYTEQSAAGASSEAFSEAGEANADRLKKARWREAGTCVHCGALYRNHGIGLEPTLDEYIENMRAVGRELWRVLRPDGTLFLNLGDVYCGGGRGGNPDEGTYRKQATNVGSLVAPTPVPCGLKPKDLVGLPWRVALALQADGWYLRSAIVWAKPNGMPGSQQDRPTSSYETIFLMSKRAHYYSDFDAIKTPPRESSAVRLAQDVQAQAGSHRANGGAKTNGPMRAVAGRPDKQRGHSRRHAGFNDRWDHMTKAEQQSAPVMMRDVWFVAPQGYSGAHFAVMPEEIARRCVLAGSRPGDLVLDPFAGSGTVGVVARRFGRRFVGLDLSAPYLALAQERIGAETLGMAL